MTLLKNFLKFFYIKWFYFSNRDKAIILKNITAGLKSRIINRTKSHKSIFIGNNVMMHGSLIVEGKGRIILEDKVNIRRDTYIGAINLIHIKAGVIISDNVKIIDNNNHPVEPKLRKEMVDSGWSNNKWSWENSNSAPIIIEENVWIGQDSRIMKGVTIGKNSIVAAGAVVTKNVMENSIVAGNPAKVVKKLMD